MTLAELKSLVETMQNLPCAVEQVMEVQVRTCHLCFTLKWVILELCFYLNSCIVLLQAVLQTVEDYQSEAQALVDDKDWRRDSSPPERLQALLDRGAELPVLVPECELLQGLQEQGRWLAEVRRTLGAEGGERREVTLLVLRNLMEAGCNVAQSVSVETAMAELQELLTIAERWEEKAQICLEQR